MTVVVVVQSIAIVVLGVLVVGLLRSHADILRALHALGVGIDGEPASPNGARPFSGDPDRRPAPDVVGLSAAGDVVAASTSDGHGFTLLAFLTSGCLTCRDFWLAFHDPALKVPAGARPVIVTKGPESESPAAVTTLAPDEVVTVMSSAAWDDYRVPVAPYFVLVDRASGTVAGEGTAPSWEQVTGLLNRAVADAAWSTANGGDDVDGALRTAGIGPGHPSLRPAPVTEDGAGVEAR